MYCECGKKILNVPPHLQKVVKWICIDCAKGAITKGRVVNPSETKKLDIAA